jgi:hypothetical protein
MQSVISISHLNYLYHYWYDWTYIIVTAQSAGKAPSLNRPEDSLESNMIDNKDQLHPTQTAEGYKINIPVPKPRKSKTNFEMDNGMSIGCSGGGEDSGSSPIHEVRQRNGFSQTRDDRGTANDSEGRVSKRVNLVKERQGDALDVTTEEQEHQEYLSIIHAEGSPHDVHTRVSHHKTDGFKNLMRNEPQFENSLLKARHRDQGSVSDYTLSGTGSDSSGSSIESDEEDQQAGKRQGARKYARGNAAGDANDKETNLGGGNLFDETKVESNSRVQSFTSPSKKHRRTNPKTKKYAFDEKIGKIVEVRENEKTQMDLVREKTVEELDEQIEQLGIDPEASTIGIEEMARALKHLKVKRRSNDEVISHVNPISSLIYLPSG